MTKTLTIALDAMGGDVGPEVVLPGASMARDRFPEARFLLFGDEEHVSRVLGSLPKLTDRAEVRHCPSIVSNDERPSVALRTGRESSMWRAIEAVRAGEADGVVSAGNTGAMMAIAKFVLRTPRGVDRPAIASFIPTMRGESVMLDLGANIQCDAGNLVQFGVMGAIFAHAVLGIEEPTVGLLNVGAEELKGNETVKAAAGRLRDLEGPFVFHGFIEGDDIPAGTTDVVATDGFSGNVALKTAEGTSKLYATFLRETFKSSRMAGLAYLLARGSLTRLRRRLDPRRYNGAVFVGLNGIVVKSHGGTDAFGFSNAVGMAVDMARHGFMNEIREVLERIDAGHSDSSSAAVV